MRRRLLIVLLALGTVGGYTSGFASLARRHHRCHSGAWGERWESRWDSRGPRGSWEPRSSTPAAEPPASPVGPR